MSIRLFDSNFLDNLALQAASSVRRRQHANLHLSYEEPCQRLFNAIGVDSYIRPHRHMADPKAETLLAVRGLLTLLIFDDHGEVSRVVTMGPELVATGGVMGVELPPGVWHTVLADVADSVLFEVKAGPFDGSAAKEHAPWAPEEGSSEVPEYLAHLRSEVIRCLSAGGAG